MNSESQKGYGHKKESFFACVGEHESVCIEVFFGQIFGLFLQSALLAILRLDNQK
jgi:hypothetical protein